jgi:hypothetical protein
VDGSELMLRVETPLFYYFNHSLHKMIYRIYSGSFPSEVVIVVNGDSIGA